MAHLLNLFATLSKQKIPLFMFQEIFRIDEMQ